ncbi:MAG: hypothetical protein M9904_03495 [Chitinophagaceae bacterium]|nr:hypothetical protein [Chitinophagaceae bacterium]
MCEFRKFTAAQTGYVAQCPSCRSIEIVYGTSVIHIGFSDWENFNEYLASVQQSYRPSENRDMKTIMLHFGGNGPLQMFLTTDELHEFCKLIDEADSEIRAWHLIELFEKG